MIYALQAFVKLILQKIPFKKWIYRISWFTLNLRVHKNNRKNINVGAVLMRFLAIALLIGFFSLKLQAASHRPQDFLQGVKGKVDEGKQIVGHFCAVCHALKPQIQIGAPRQGVELEWQGRIKQGLLALLEHTDEGLNSMPARGGCFECSDEQLLKAIMVLVPAKHREDLMLQYKNSVIEKTQ